ncbi:MAG: long-chain acyl-CoA synthetase [Planctomycetota bacterium]|jgi:long-chain acyl-CoA synthetase
MADTIEALVRRAAATRPDAVAVDDGTVALSYGDLVAAADRGALALRAAGMQDGEPVVVPVSGRAADLAAFLSVWRAGGAAAPVHRTTPSSVAEGLRARLGARLSMEDAPARIADCAPRQLDGAGTVMFTSGSTGVPKGVLLSAARAADKLAMIGAMTNWREGERAVIALQLTFSFGQWATWLTLARGGRVDLRGRFDVAEILALSAGATRLPAAPTMLRRLAEAGGAPFKGTIMAGGEPLPAALGARVRAAFPAAGLGDIYGLTETGTSDFFVQPDDYDQLAGTIGRAGQGIDWRLGEGGELQIRSPWGMLGYLDAPDLTEAAFADGWFRTGDLAAETNGTVRLIGRAKDLVIRSGNKVAPLEVEAVFLSHPDIAAALVAGAPDPDRGEALHLAVVARVGTTLDPQALRDWAAERLERWKLPDHVHVMADLPTGATGKADRGALRALVGGA